MAARAGNRMQAMQTCRTIHRMERRRSMFRDAMTPNEPEPQPVQHAAPTPAAPSYLAELETLAHLHAQGVLSTEEYEAKKKKILGI